MVPCCNSGMRKTVVKVTEREMVSVVSSCSRSEARAGGEGSLGNGGEKGKCGSELFKSAKEEGSLGHGGG